MECSSRFHRLSVLALLCFLTTLVPVGSQSLIPPESQQLFELFNVVSIHDLKHTGTEEASYTLRTQLKINSVWHSKNEQLLQVYFTDSTVSAPAKAHSKQITQELEKIPDRPFYISLIDGKPSKVIAHTSRDQSLLNLERGIASLLQLQRQTGAVSEVDVSGHCMSFYNVKSSTRISKVKTDCSHWDLRVNYRAEKPLGVSQLSLEQIEFVLNAEGALLKAASSEEHRVSLESKPDVGSEVVSEFVLNHLAVGDATSVKQLEFTTLDAAIQSLLEWYRVFDIEADVDGALSEIKGISLNKRIFGSRTKLGDDQIGKESLALLMAELLPVARITKQSEFTAILKSYKDIRAQLVDLLAAVQTAEAHNAINEVFNYNDNSVTDILEKYLQSLALSTHPEREIIDDLFKRLQGTAAGVEAIENEKLRDTVMQTVASLTKQSGFDPNDPLLQQVRSYILEQLNEQCKEQSCKLIYIRALQNLQDASTLPVLIENVLTEDIAGSVAAMHALKNFPIVNFNEEHRKIFTTIFYQQQRKFDTSVRTMALDILLALKPTKSQLQDLLVYLDSNDRQYEIKTFVIQKLRMLSEKCPRFAALLKGCLAELPKVNNYHVIGQKGMTTVLSRQLSQSPAFNETLLSVQEINSGVLKRGSVELLLAAGKDELSTFKIGMYTNGLNSFVSDSDEDESDDSPATAGMEISVQGVLLRPLVFFSGQTELMGHVWSGTASDPTPAFQATVLAEDHEHYVLLASGATAFVRVLGMRSIDLNGKVEMSLWNRNANTEINQNSGDAIVGTMMVGFTYAKLENKFTVTNEPKISLQADIDFYSGVKLCMRLQRPEMLLKHSNTKSVYLNASKTYAKHISTKFLHKLNGRTLALNQKNNEMCNSIFEDE